MDNLRIILLICGVILLAGIYIWGVIVSRRSGDKKARGDAGDEIENEIELLERVQDSRAAQNASSLKELNDFDIDEDLEEAKPPAAAQESEPAPEPAPPPPPKPPPKEERDEGKFRPVFAAGARERTPADEASRDKTDLVADLSEIRATLAPEPVIQGDQLDLLREEQEVRRVEAQEKGRDATPTSAGKKAQPADTLVLAITVMAKEGERFAGENLRTWFETLKLRHGEMGLFHYRPPGKPLRAPPTFSVASVLKPGSFDVEQMEDITVPGICMFVRLPGPDDPVAAFEEMLRTARKLAEGLDGVVCDETRSSLTGQAINHMRERIAEYSRKQRLRF